RDQALLLSAVSDAAANLSAFVPSLSTCEVLAFGEGVALPARLIFKELPPHLLPRSEALGMHRAGLAHASHEYMVSVLEHWRGATMSGKLTFETAGAPEAASMQPREASYGRPRNAPIFAKPGTFFKPRKKTPPRSLYPSGD